MTDLPADVKWVNLNTDSKDGQTGSNPGESVSKKMLRGIKGIIFDFDGTLFDSSFIAFHVIMANLFDLYRIRSERLIRRSFAGRDFINPEEYYKEFFTKLGKICLKRPEKMRAWYFNRYMPRMTQVLKKHYKPRPGLVEFLQRMDAADAPLKIAIYSDYPILKERMEAIGISVKNINLYGPESFGAQKPAVRPFLKIANELGLSPEEILVIGDREDTDGLGAFHSKMHFFCLETGRRRYFRLDPDRRRPANTPHGPTLLMYAGKWDGLMDLLKGRL